MSKYGVFLVRIFLYLVQIQENTDTGKHGTEKTPYLGYFQAVKINGKLIVKKQLSTQCNSSVKYRHFTLPKACFHVMSSDLAKSLLQKNLKITRVILFSQELGFFH